MKNWKKSWYWGMWASPQPSASARMPPPVKERHISDPNEIYGLIRDITAEMMRGGEELNLSTKPSVVLVIGVNGVGKTTTIGKLAYRLKQEGRQVSPGRGRHVPCCRH